PLVICAVEAHTRSPFFWPQLRFSCRAHANSAVFSGLPRKLGNWLPSGFLRLLPTHIYRSDISILKIDGAGEPEGDGTQEHVASYGCHDPVVPPRAAIHADGQKI